MLGLRFCARAFSSRGKRGPLFIAVRGPLTIVASPVEERRLSNCGSRAQSLHGMWDLPRPGPEPVSPALAGRPSTTAPPGKPSIFNVIFKLLSMIKDFLQNIATIQRKPTAQMPGLFLLTSKICQSTSCTYILRALLLLSYLTLGCHICSYTSISSIIIIS